MPITGHRNDPNSLAHVRREAGDDVIADRKAATRRRLPSAWLTALLVVGGIAAGAFAPGAGAAAHASTAVKPTPITVIATEFKFTLSKPTVAPGTTVVFTVINKGKIAHDFRLLGASLSARTPTLAPGKRATLTVTFAKKGLYSFLCTLPGHAAAGMKGTFPVGVKPAPAATPITVVATEFKFTLSKPTVAPGTTVVFTVINKGKIAHDFRLLGASLSARTPTLAPGKRATLTVTFAKKGLYSFLCTLPGHAAAGMKGTFPVGVKPAPAATPITVVATEFKFTLSKPTVAPGTTVVFTVINKGKIAHDFRLLGASLSARTPTLAPGKRATLTVTFAKKGLYSFLCTLPGHAAAGMKGTFPVGVKPAPAATTTTAAATTTTAAVAPAPAPAAPVTLQGDPVAGKAVFAANGCGGCHTLAAAGSNGTVGPNLDAIKPSQGLVAATVQSGASGDGVQMPAFNLSATNLANISAFVYASTHP